MRLIDADALIKELEEEAKAIEEEASEIKENMPVLKNNLRGRADGIRDALIEIIGAPTVELSWDEMLVICDNCGHAIHVKKDGDER